MSNEGTVAFLGGVGASEFRVADRDAVDEDFGPFYVGPYCDWVCRGGAVGVGKQLDILFDSVSYSVELGLSGGVVWRPLPWALGLPAGGGVLVAEAFASLTLGCRSPTDLVRAVMELLMERSSAWS